MECNNMCVNIIQKMRKREYDLGSTLKCTRKKKKKYKMDATPVKFDVILEKKGRNANFIIIIFFSDWNLFFI